MKWQEILKEDLTEKVIGALIPMYGNREGVFDSFMMGAMREEDLQRPYTKDDVKDLIKDIEFAANVNEGGAYGKIKETLDKLERLL
tara:strand:+ start:196 stop:453 length:258 start_codon:yes stop_codon:yes gene_type:complete